MKVSGLLAVAVMMVALTASPARAEEAAPKQAKTTKQSTGKVDQQIRAARQPDADKKLNQDAKKLKAFTSNLVGNKKQAPTKQAVTRPAAKKQQAPKQAPAQ